MKSRPSFRRRSSINANIHNSQADSDDDLPLSLSQDRPPPSRLSEVSLSMDRTSVADPDRLTVLMSESEGLKQELRLHIIEKFKFDGPVTSSDTFVVKCTTKLDGVCLHERRGQVLHLFYLRRGGRIPVFKERTKIPALSAAVVNVHRSERLLVLSPDLILRIHAPWSTRLNIVVPLMRSWRKISNVHDNQVTLTDANGNMEGYHMDLVPRHRLVEWCLDVLECILDSALYPLFLSVYGTVKLKTSTDDLSAFTITLFACFLACNTRSPSPGPSSIPEPKPKIDPWQAVQMYMTEDPTSPGRSRLKSDFNHLSLLPQAREFQHHFEGTQRSSHLTVILLALHALSEEIRMHIGMSRHNRDFLVILCQLAYWLGRPKFVEYYMASDINMESVGFDRRHLAGLRDSAFAQEDPWSIYLWLIDCIRGISTDSPKKDLLTLETLLHKAYPDKSSSTKKLEQARSLLPSIVKLRHIYPLLTVRDPRADLIQTMQQQNITTIWLDSLPLGVSYPLKTALSQCQRDPLPTWSSSSYDLINRKDLVEFLRLQSHDAKPTPVYTCLPRSSEDTSTVTEICQEVQSQESVTNGPTFADDHERITNLIFRKDRRMLEVHKLLEFSQPGVTFWFRTPPSVTYYPDEVHANVVNMLLRWHSRLRYRQWRYELLRCPSERDY